MFPPRFILTRLKETLIVLDMGLFKCLVVFGLSSFYNPFNCFFEVNVFSIVGFGILREVSLGTEIEGCITCACNRLVSHSEQ